MNEVYEFEKILKELGVTNQWDRPLILARNQPDWYRMHRPRIKDEDPLASIDLRIYRETKEYRIDAAYRHLEFSKNEEISVEMMRVFIDILSHAYSFKKS